MTLVVVPFHDGKSRLSPRREVRRPLALAMLADVVSACVAVGETLVVTSDADGVAVAARLGASVLADPGSGQAGAVAAALVDQADEPVLVVNADVPAVTVRDLRALLSTTPDEGIALVEAADGTTNALALSAGRLFAPLYGAGSAARFAADARARGHDAVPVLIPSLRDDVDTLEDLEALRDRSGAQTRAALAELEQGALA
jgi:2-phospho-L-lactate/phosphoenolpyruvate guanylyltransferase